VLSLPDAEALELLSSVAGIAINSAAVNRILADTHNNPLALVELGTEYTAGQLSGRAALPEPLPLGQRLREHFLRQVRSMSPNARTSGLRAEDLRRRQAQTRTFTFLLLCLAWGGHRVRAGQK